MNKSFKSITAISQGDKISVWPVVALLLLAAAWIAAYEVAPYFSDDWGYIFTFRSIDGPGRGLWPAGRWWSWAPFHWLHVNGRAANYLAACALAFLPKWLVSALAGAAVGWMTLMVARLGGVWARRGYAALCCAALAAVTIVFPWWNYLFSIDVNFNYVLSSALLLTFLWLATRHRHISLWLTVPLGLLAGAMHEAASLPVAAGLVWLWWRSGRCPLPRAAAIAFGAGCLEVASSPGIWTRLSDGAGADHNLLLTILFSTPITVVMALTLCVMLCSTGGRRRLKLFFGDVANGFWLIAAVGATAFCAVSGVTGRSGWFAGLYSLIFMIRLGVASGVRVSRVAGGVIAAILSVSAIAVALAPIPALYASRLDVEAITAAARRAPRGSDLILCRDLYDEHRQPPCTLGRARAFEPSDGLTQRFWADYYRLRSLVVLPAEMQGVSLDSLAVALTPGRTYALTDGSVIAPGLPSMADSVSEGDAILYLPAVPPDVCVHEPVLCYPVHTPSGATLYYLLPQTFFFGEHSRL